MNNITNITKIYVEADMSPVIKHYNGSWHVIDHASSDGQDYSISIWETYYSNLEDLQEEYGIEDDELTDEDCAKAWEYTMDCFADFGIQIVKR